MMSGTIIFRLRRRRAISTMIGGVIVLSLLLTALGTMVFVTQQWDQYQQTVNKMAQYRNQQMLENLVAISPGLAVVASAPGWGSGCGTTYICYNATISNLGTVGVQITRIYINSTATAGLGCSSPNPTPCILNPTKAIAPYAFNQANEFLNPGEANHVLLLALPFAVLLPNPIPAFPQNTILIATSRGNVFSFQWPFQLAVFGQSQSAFSSGNIKVAYQGAFDSKNERASGGSGGSGYCHTEARQSYPAGAGYAENLTGITGLQTGTTLYFVNPWITGGNSNGILDSANAGATTVYIYVVVINTGNTVYAPIAGTIDLTWYGSNHLDGPLFGVYYNGKFYTTSPSIAPGMSYYAIFKLTIFSIQSLPWNVQPGYPSVMLWGAASLTNALGTSAEDQSFFSGTILLSGLWIRYEASTGGCA
jgi:hypothetical protein